MKNRFSPWIRQGHLPKLTKIYNTIQLDDLIGSVPGNRYFCHEMSDFVDIMIF
jgi:hypothetical protein